MTCHFPGYFPPDNSSDCFPSSAFALELCYIDIPSVDVAPFLTNKFLGEKITKHRDLVGADAGSFDFMWGESKSIILCLHLQNII